MKINILDIKELENGSAEIIIDMDLEAKKYLLNFAFMELIKNELVEVSDLWEEYHEDGNAV